MKHDDLKEAAQRFVEELSAGKEFIADHKPAQTEVLDAGIKTVQEELASLLGNLHEGLYVNADSPPADVVNALEQLQERLAQLKVSLADHTGPKWPDAHTYKTALKVMCALQSTQAAAMCCVVHGNFRQQHVNRSVLALVHVTTVCKLSYSPPAHMGSLK